MIGISPLVDFAFKAILGSPEHSRVTVHFLNALLAPPRITEVRILNPFLGQESDGDKLAVLDIRATDELGRQLNIEVQTTLPAGLAQRLTYYAASLYSGQLSEGDPYTASRPAITICVLRTALFPQLPGLHLDFRLREQGGQIFTNDLQIHLLELAKAPLAIDNKVDFTPAERWARFLVLADELEPEEIARQFADQEFSEAAGVLAMISQTTDQKLLYELRLKAQRDEIWRLSSSRQEGREEGFLSGRVQTFQELLGKKPTPIAELSLLSTAELAALADSLRKEWDSRPADGSKANPPASE